MMTAPQATPIRRGFSGPHPSASPFHTPGTNLPTGSQGPALIRSSQLPQTFNQYGVPKPKSKASIEMAGEISSMSTAW